eukprot:4255027-Pyramimonas_sp.AAC.1
MARIGRNAASCAPGTNASGAKCPSMVPMRLLADASPVRPWVANAARTPWTCAGMPRSTRKSMTFPYSDCPKERHTG